MPEDPKIKVQYIKDISTFLKKNSNKISFHMFAKKHLIDTDFRENLENILTDENVEISEKISENETALICEILDLFYVFSKNYIRKDIENEEDLYQKFYYLIKSIATFETKSQTKTTKKLSEIIRKCFEKRASDTEDENIELLNDSLKNIKKLGIINSKYKKVSSKFLENIITNYIYIIDISRKCNTSHDNSSSLDTIKRKMSLLASESSIFTSELNLEDVKIGEETIIEETLNEEKVPEEKVEKKTEQDNKTEQKIETDKQVKKTMKLKIKQNNQSKYGKFLPKIIYPINVIKKNGSVFLANKRNKK